jgi:nicotinamidase-related amidase
MRYSVTDIRCRKVGLQLGRRHQHASGFDMQRQSIVLLTLLIATISAASVGQSFAAEDSATRVPNRPRTPGVLELELRSRDDQSGEARKESAHWQAAEMAIIICDMWDDHYCELAAQRVGVMAPKMNRVLSAARSHGVMIIHAPSGCMDVYADTPHRKRMQQAAHAEPPVPIGKWCYLDPEVESALPIEDEVSPCDDPVVGPQVRKYSRQHVAIDIIGYDGVSDSGAEIYNFCRQEGIKNIVLMGVHTNMCVLGRPFGIRQQVRLGMNVALCRDLTDAMYDPRQPPYVSHDRGTQLVVEHIEKYWCPSIESAHLTHVFPGSADPVPADAPSAKQTSAIRKAE